MADELAAMHDPENVLQAHATACLRGRLSILFNPETGFRTTLCGSDLIGDP